MPCLDENLAAAFVGGSMAADAHADAALHVEGCPECRQLVAALIRGDRAQAAGVSHAATLPSSSPVTTAPERGTLVGRYVVLEPIGEGGMGAVYSAYDPILERKVALKLVRAAWEADTASEVKARLLREGKSIARLSHPNIVAVHDMGTFRGEVFIAMELVEGSTLKQWLRAKKRGWREVLDKFLAAGEGLAAAHRANLVHRDFKPENVLLGSDGRVRVSDFGLARSYETHSTLPDLRLPPGAVSSPEGAVVTQAGALVGTPAYMSPEQHARVGADAQSDQFSFCMSLWEALYGALPYAQPRATAAWRLVEPPAGADVPPWLRRAVERGLALEPDSRYSGLEELLAALAADPGKARRRRVRLGVTVGLSVLAVAAPSAWLSTRGGRLCQGAAGEVAAVWNPAHKGAVRAAFLATGRADATAELALAERALDAYWQAWAAMRTGACEATRVRGEQSDQVLSLRMACLDRRRGEAAALLELLGRADSEVVANAPAAVSALTGLASCSDVEALLAQVRPPEDPAVRVRLESVRARIGQAKARLDAGKYSDALALASEAVAAAKALAYRPAEAEALFLQGQTYERSGELGPAEQALLDAIAAAEAGRHDEVTARAATHLMLVLGARQARYAEAHAWGKLAGGAVARIGASGELRAALLQSEGLVLYAEGHLSEAVDHHQQAVALLEKLEPDGLNLAEALEGLGAAERGDRKPREALAAYDRALAIWAKKLGPDSDRVATARNGIANVHMLEGRFEEALAVYREALLAYEKTLGPTHFRTVTTVNNIGVVYAELGRYSEALPYFERVLAVRESALKETDAKVADAHSNLGMLLVELGRTDEARAHFEKAKGILQGYPLDHFSQAEYLLGFAKLDLAAGAPVEAIGRLERALALCADKEGFRFEYTRARASFLLGKALWDGRHDAKRAVTTAAGARDALAGLGRARFRRDLAEVEGWLAAHPCAEGPNPGGPGSHR